MKRHRVGPRGERFDPAISARLRKEGFLENYMGGGTYGYVRDTDNSTIILTSADEPDVAPHRMTEGVLIGVESKYKEGGDTHRDLIAEFRYPSLRSALEMWRLM